MRAVSGSYEEYAVTYFDEKAERIAAHLKRLADGIRTKMSAADISDTNPTKTYGELAADIQSGILRGLANLGLDRLAVFAATADAGRARRLAEQGPKPTN